MFTPKMWADLVQAQFNTINTLTASKGEEYSGSTDRLRNFRQISAEIGIEMEVVIWTYLKKHLDSLASYVNDCQHHRNRQYSESIPGRVDDAIMYLLLLKASMIERAEQDRIDNDWARASMTEASSTP